MERTAGSALEKSENNTWGIFSLVQNVARSFSPLVFSFTNSTSACLAAERSGKPVYQSEYDIRSWAADGPPPVRGNKKKTYPRRHLQRRRAMGGFRVSCMGGLPAICRGHIRCGDKVFGIDEPFGAKVGPYLEGWRNLMFHDPSSWTSTELEIISISFASSARRFERTARILGSIPLPRRRCDSYQHLTNEHRELCLSRTSTR